MNIVELRNEIDAIDTNLVDLIQKRMSLSLEIAKYKNDCNLMVLDAGREKEVLENVTSKVSPEFEEVIRSLFISIMEHSRNFQQDYLSSCK